MIVILDSGPLGRVVNPRARDRNDECNLWLGDILARGIEVRVPEIADYEIRRELLRGGRTAALRRLDDLKNALGYLPITTPVMLRAAELWARARQMGRPTADDKALDGDMILTAQFDTVKASDPEAVNATENIGHLSLFAQARHWNQIP